MMKRILAAAVLAMVSMGAVQEAAKPKLPLIVAHRGASFDAPENTLAAFKLGWEQGADAIEGDFWLTKDGKIACIHDATLKRTGKVEGDVREMTLEDVRKVDVGTWKNARYAGEKTPLFTDVLAAIPEGKLFFLEIKCGPEIVPAIKAELEAAKFPLERLRVISFKEDTVKVMRETMPQVKAYWLTDFKKDKQTKKPTIGLKEVLATLKETKATGLDVNANLEMVNEAFVKALRDNGYEFHAWTVDDPAVAKRLVELGVDSITTNKPALIRAELSK